MGSVTLLVEVFSPNVGELVLRHYMADAVMALLDHLTDAEEPQGHLLRASTLGPFPDDEKRGSVVDEQLNGLEILLEPHLHHPV